jgi:hypothetical protein
MHVEVRQTDIFAAWFETSGTGKLVLVLPCGYAGFLWEIRGT